MHAICYFSQEQGFACELNLFKAASCYYFDNLASFVNGKMCCAFDSFVISEMWCIAACIVEGRILHAVLQFSQNQSVITKLLKYLYSVEYENSFYASHLSLLYMC
jgi:hypothetical protein